MNKYIIEFLGTLFIVFVFLATGNWLAIGAALSVTFLLGAAISGGAFNPAIALVLMAGGKISTKEIIPYIVAEIAGALVGFELVRLFMR